MQLVQNAVFFLVDGILDLVAILPKEVRDALCLGTRAWKFREFIAVRQVRVPDDERRSGIAMGRLLAENHRF